MLTGRPARCIRNAFADDLIASGLPPVAFPAQMSVTAPLQDTGDRELTLLFAGQSVAFSRDTNAGALVEAIAEETGRRLGYGWGVKERTVEMLKSGQGFARVGARPRGRFRFLRPPCLLLAVLSYSAAIRTGTGFGSNDCLGPSPASKTRVASSCRTPNHSA
jgi:hypothetical protein